MKKILFGARTHFSQGYSILTPKSVVMQAKQAGYEGVAIADVHSINALTDAFKEADQQDINVIVGATIRVVDDISWRRAARGEPKKKPNPFFMPSLYIKNDAGLKDLSALLSLAQDEDHFYFVPQVDLNDLLETAAKGNVIVTTGSAHSLLSHANSSDILIALKKALPDSHLYVELTPVDNAYYDRITELGAKAAIESNLPVVHSRPVWFSEGESSLRNTLDCILNRTKVGEVWRNEVNQGLFTVSPDELKGEVIAATKRLYSCRAITCKETLTKAGVYHGNQRAAGLCDYKWHEMDISLPKMADDPTSSLVKLAKLGWFERIAKPVFGYQPSAELIPQYKARLLHELKVIKDLGFQDYFLVVRDLINWAKDNGIQVGCGRGSAAGSLLSFLIGITDVDPIRFHLIFERFLNPDRLDWPDIDIDFMSSRRHEVIEYLSEKYGEERVAGISNYGMLGGKSALRQVASAHALTEPEFSCSKQVGDGLLEESIDVPDVRKFAENNGKIWGEAVGLQGVYRSAGKHAAGIVVAGEPLINRAVVERRKDGLVVNWDKRTVEQWGLIKLDILGLTTLDLLAKAVGYVKKKTGEIINLTSLPIDDEPTLQAFSKGETLGIFQFEGGMARHMLKEAGEEGTLSFEEVSAITALNRPGPLESGIAEKWMNVRKGFEPLEYLIPELEPFLQDTYGQCIYQEQVMQIAQVLCDFSMSEADHLRKAMGKKVPAEMEKYKEKFVSGAKDKIGESAAEELWDDLEKFAGYAFNRAHSAAYSLISYQSMWIKVHYPECFYAAALTVLKEEKLQAIVKEAESKNIYVVPPDINRSSNQFEIGYDKERDQTVLYAPFQAIKGLSEKAAAAIMQAKSDIGRDFSSKEEFVSVVNRRACNVRGQTSLDEVGAFANIEPDQIPARHPDRIRSQKQLLPGLISLNVKADRKIEISPYVKKEIVNLVADWRQAGDRELGISTHPTPRLGSKAKFMIVGDFPMWSECKAGKFGEGKSFDPVKKAMSGAKLALADCYITSLVKCEKPKDVDDLAPIINCYSEFLDREIEALKPPVIITLGTKSLRRIVPDAKGSWEELAGTTHYIPALDCTVVCGINPGMLYFEPSRQKLLDNAFSVVAELLD